MNARSTWAVEVLPRWVPKTKAYNPMLRKARKQFKQLLGSAVCEGDPARARQRCTIVGTAANIGGVEQVIITLAEHLQASGRDVDVVFPVPHDVERFLAWCATSGFAAARVSASLTDAAAPHNVATTRALARFARTTPTDVFNIHYGDNFMSLKDLIGYKLGRPRARLVVTVHHPKPWASTSRRKRWMTRAAGWLADAVVVVSNATKEIVLETPVAAHKVAVISNGIKLAGRQRDRDAARAAFGLGPDDIAVVSVCRLVEHKRVDDLIRAAAAANVDGMRLLIGGDGPQREALTALASELPAARAHLVGYVASIDDLLAAADVFALPSELEGFGMVYVEAAAHQVPSIAGNVGGAREVIVDGVTGILVEPGDIVAIAEALRRLATAPGERRAMGAAAAARAAANYGAVSMAQRYANVLALAPGRPVSAAGYDVAPKSAQPAQSKTKADRPDRKR